MSDLIEREYLLNIARQDGAYGYVSEQEILNAPNAETTGALDDAIQEYIKDGYILAEPKGNLMSREELINYLYENNVHADIKIEDLADEISAEPLVTVKAKQNEGLYLDTDEETLLETEYIVVATDGWYKEYIHETDGKPKVGKWISVASFEAFGGDEICWEIRGNPTAFHYCSACKEQAYVDEFGNEILSKYCPECGAKMEGSE